MLFRHPLRRYLSRLLFGLGSIGMVLLIQGCGFRLQGASPLPFNKLYTNISLNSSFGAQLERMLVANTPELTFVDKRDDAQASLIQLQNRRILGTLHSIHRVMSKNINSIYSSVSSCSITKGARYFPPPPWSLRATCPMIRTPPRPRKVNEPACMHRWKKTSSNVYHGASPHPM